MPTLLGATRLAWEQAHAWGEAVYVVERPSVPPAAPAESRQALHIRRLYLQALGGDVSALPAPAPRCADDGDWLTFDTMPVSEVRRRLRAGQCPVLVRVASPAGQVDAVPDQVAEAARLVR